MDDTAPKQPGDFPEPPALTTEEEFVWDEDQTPVTNFANLGERLAQSGDLYRVPAHGGGLLLVPEHDAATPVVIQTASQLAPLLVDRVRVRVMKSGQCKGHLLPARYLTPMLPSEAFLQQFRPLDRVLKSPGFLPEFVLVKPGYNDGGPGNRVLYLGPKPRLANSPDAITAFLDVMAFASNADRTNTVAAALTVMLRTYWPGGKPALLVTSTKSHGGKETVISFAAGATPQVSISYQATDWALERTFVGALKLNPELGLIDVENARLGKQSDVIASAFLERYLTDSAPMLFSTGTGAAVRRQNNVMVAISTNFGSVSQDLLNRALPIHLAPVGDVASRKSAIGNPKLEYLPTHREQIEAELRGMIEKWKEAGMPLDNDVKHPFTGWARTIGGILKVNHFTDFLANYSLRRTADDPLREALGLLGEARPDAWLRPSDWAKIAVERGLLDHLMSQTNRRTDVGRARGMGMTLSAHQEETFTVKTDDFELKLGLEQARRRFDVGQEPSTRYQFKVMSRESVPEDPARVEEL